MKLKLLDAVNVNRRCHQIEPNSLIYTLYYYAKFQCQLIVLDLKLIVYDSSCSRLQAMTWPDKINYFWTRMPIELLLLTTSRHIRIPTSNYLQTTCFFFMVIFFHHLFLTYYRCPYRDYFSLIFLLYYHPNLEFLSSSTIIKDKAALYLFAIHLLMHSWLLNLYMGYFQFGGMPNFLMKNSPYADIFI